MKKLIVLSVAVLIVLSGCFSTPAREVTNICNLLDELQINTGLESLGVTSDKVTELALKASKDAAAQTNPRKASIAQLETLILESLQNAR